MAAQDFNPAQKPHVYDLLGRLNAAFARITRNMSALEQLGIFDAQTMKRLYRLSKEFQADTNYHLLETLRGYEERDWARFGKMGREREKR